MSEHVVGQETIPDRRASRRTMLKAAVVGSAALAAGSTLASRPAKAAWDGVGLPPQPWFVRWEMNTAFNCPPFPIPCGNYFEAPVGEITLGGILLTYVSAPLSARGSLSYSLSNTRTETMRVIDEESRELNIAAEIGPFSTSGNSRFGVGGSAERIQGRSTKVTNAITHSSTQTQTIQTAPPAAGGYNSWDNTAFLIMARPVLSINLLFKTLNISNPHPAATWLIAPGGTVFIDPARPQLGGYPTGPYHRFAHGGTIFPRSARELRDDPATRNFLGPETADAILAEYPLRPDQTSGVQLGLGAPRFGPPTPLAPGATPFSFNQSMTSTTTRIEEHSRFVTTTIKAGFSLTVGTVSIFKFGIGRTITTRHTSVQENSSSQVVSISGTLSSDLNRLNHIYEDRVWNTLLITDEGPLAGPFAAVSGVVTGGDGKPVNGAVVTMVVGELTHVAFTDAEGRYTFKLNGDVKPGRYEVTCAGVTRAATVSPTATAAIDYERVDSGLARERSR